jgi:bacterioferritin
MRRYDRVLDRILELDGRPASRDSSTLCVGHHVPEILRSDIRLEEALISELLRTSTSLELINDPKTHSLLADILKAEQQYLDWLRTQLDEIDDNGAGTDAPGRATRGGLKSAQDPVVSSLNEILKIELSAITQVYYHSRMFEAWGIKKPHEFTATETYEKTYRSVAILKRLLALDGTPAPEDHGRLLIGSEVSEMLLFDLKVQESLIPLLHGAVDCCDSHGDQETGQVLRGILEGEQKHADWLEAQFDAIEQHGMEAYTQSSI